VQKMSRRRFGKAIGARSARKLIREIGGAPALDLIAELERVIGQRHGFEIVQLNDGRVLQIFYGSASIYSSSDKYRTLLTSIEDRGKRPIEHPLGARFRNGTGFIDAVPSLVQELPQKLRIPLDALDGSVDGLERLDRAAQRRGGQECLDDPTILAPLVAYVGEVIRNVTGGDWSIEGHQGRAWEPVVVDPDGRQYSTFVIFKQLLERGSMYVVVSHQTGGVAAPPPPRKAGLFASREQPDARATGALGAVPDNAYHVTKRYGDGRPWRVTFHRDVETEGFPFSAGTEAWFKRGGDIISGVLSTPCSFGPFRFPAGTFVRFYSGHRDGRLSDVKLGADHDISGLPCKGGTNVFFDFHKRQAYLSSATLAAEHQIDGVMRPAGTWFARDRRGHVTDSRPPGWRP
jgi:hypothetical protein